MGIYVGPAPNYIDSRLIHRELDQELPGTERYWELINYLNDPNAFLDKYYPEEKEIMYETNCRGQVVRAVSFKQ